MKYKLFRIRINTYYFGNKSYYIFVLAEDSDEALEYVYKSSQYSKDEDAEIEEIYEISYDVIEPIYKLKPIRLCGDDVILGEEALMELYVKIN